MCQNLITLCSNTHKLWGRARFALEPLHLADDKKSLRVRFFWLKCLDYNKRVRITIRPNLSGTLDSGPRQAKLFDCLSEKKILSGDELILTTDDPKDKPLPSIDLLQMQWTLNRIAAISGAADAPDEVFDSSDDDEEQVCVRDDYGG